MHEHDHTFSSCRFKRGILTHHIAAIIAQLPYGHPQYSYPPLAPTPPFLPHPTAPQQLLQMTHNVHPLVAPGNNQAVVGTGIPQPASVVSVQTANAAPPPPSCAADALESQPAPAGQYAGKKRKSNRNAAYQSSSQSFFFGLLVQLPA